MIDELAARVGLGGVSLPLGAARELHGARLAAAGAERLGDLRDAQAAALAVPKTARR